MTTPTPTPRSVYCVLTPRSLPYAQLAFESLMARSLDDLDLTLITDEQGDKVLLEEAMEKLIPPSRHVWRVRSKADADERAAELFANLPELAGFRSGHPCWRKITDPLLFAAPGHEIVVIDPDLYFPNEFRFETTPPTGVLLMHQPPNCMGPDEVVRRAYEQDIPLAHHVDIGVGQWRNDVDLEWLDATIGRLGGASLPCAMHVEVIVWAALAMRVGGGYLDPEQWRCWRNSQWNRLLVRVGTPGRRILRAEPFQDMKCFHGGGAAKWWIPDVVAAGEMPPSGRLSTSTPIRPFEELTRADYESTQRLKRWAGRAGYYRLAHGRSSS